ncbi:unnamed protein product [Symbiodinium sp. CCMP2456]|nr:unnamed protein product [Symbiodinium sp. CCMP2456]
MVIACTVRVALAQQPLLNPSMKKLAMLVAMQDQSSIVHGIENIPNLTGIFHICGRNVPTQLLEFPDAKPWVKKNFEACMATFWGWAPMSSSLSSIAIHNEEELCTCAAIDSSASDADFESRLGKVLDCRWLIHADKIAATACFAEACPSAVKDDSH